LYRDGDEVKDIEDRIEKVLAKLRSQPISWVDEMSKMPLTVTYSDLRMIIFSTLYSPTLAFPMVATIINLLHEGYDEILKQLFGYRGNFDAQPFCSNALPRTLYPDEAQIAIMCSDKRYRVRTASLIVSK
jgi:siroheme synthase (precorrin-2 oxidase/ferrochelatase)